jgi:hypothetical protein
MVERSPYFAALHTGYEYRRICAILDRTLIVFDARHDNRES